MRLRKPLDRRAPLSAANEGPAQCTLGLNAPQIPCERRRRAREGMRDGARVHNTRETVMRSKPKRPKNKAASPGGGQRRMCDVRGSAERTKAPPCCPPVSVAPALSCVNSDDERVLVD